MKLTREKVIDYFPDDNRFIHHVMRKNGWMIFRDDDMESVRFQALYDVMRLVNSEYEFDDEDHITALVDLNIRRAFFTMLRKNDNLNNQIDIRTESEFILSDDDEQTTAYEKAEADDKFDWYSELILVTRKVTTDKDADILEGILQGYTLMEIGNRYGVSSQAIDKRKKKIIKKLRLYYEIDTPINKKRSKKIRAGVRSKPSPKYKAEVHSHTEAMSFLGLIS